MTTMEEFLARAIDPREFDQPVFQHDPFPLYKRLRDDHPIYHDRFHNRWVISGYWDVNAAFQDNAGFDRAVYKPDGKYQFGSEHVFGPNILEYGNSLPHRWLRNVVAGQFGLSPPIIGPADKLGFLDGGTHEEAIYRGADRTVIAGSGSRDVDTGCVPQARHRRTDDLSLEDEVRGHGCIGCEAVEGTRAREQRAEADRGGSDARQPDVAGRERKKVLSLPERRRSVTYLKTQNAVSERRACQVLSINRSSYRYCGRRDPIDATHEEVVRLSDRYDYWGYRMIRGGLENLDARVSGKPARQ